MKWISEEEFDSKIACSYSVASIANHDSTGLS